MLKHLSWFALILAGLGGCTAQQLSLEEANELPPLALCKEYEYWSTIVAQPGHEGFSRASVVSRLKSIYISIEERSIDCPKLLAKYPESSNSKKSGKGVVNCMPNAVTGGITCF